MRDPQALAAHRDRQLGALSEAVARFVEPSGEERVLDAGAGAGALAFAIAPHVREVVALELVGAHLDAARALAPAYANVRFVEGDATRMPFGDGEFDLAATRATLHHVARPELAVAELARVARRGGRILVVDQIAPADPLVALELDRFERARDAQHARLLPDGDVRALLEANDLVLVRDRFEQDVRPLDPYLDLAGCADEARERARGLAPGDPYVVTIGWYLAEKR